MTLSTVTSSDTPSEANRIPTMTTTTTTTTTRIRIFQRNKKTVSKRFFKTKVEISSLNRIVATHLKRGNVGPKMSYFHVTAISLLCLFVEQREKSPILLMWTIKVDSEQVQFLCYLIESLIIRDLYLS